MNHALIIGAGVTGLTTAISLYNKGITSTVVAEKFMPDIVSAVAGALWEWPPAVCGYHHDQISLERSKYWSMVSYKKFNELSKIPSTGVYIRPVNFYFRNKIEEHHEHLEKMNEIMINVPGFRRTTTPELIKNNGVNCNINLVDSYTHLAPMIDTDVYMKWLMDKVEGYGIKIIQKK